jgi:hypothetical protein
MGPAAGGTTGSSCWKFLVALSCQTRNLSVAAVAADDEPF